MSSIFRDSSPHGEERGAAARLEPCVAAVRSSFETRPTAAPQDGGLIAAKLICNNSSRGNNTPHGEGRGTATRLEPCVRGSAIILRDAAYAAPQDEASRCPLRGLLRMRGSRGQRSIYAAPPAFVTAGLVRRSILLRCTDEAATWMRGSSPRRREALRHSQLCFMRRPQTLSS